MRLRFVVMFEAHTRHVVKQESGLSLPQVETTPRRWHSQTFLLAWMQATPRPHTCSKENHKPDNYRSVVVPKEENKIECQFMFWRTIQCVILYWGQVQHPRQPPPAPQPASVCQRSTLFHITSPQHIIGLALKVGECHAVRLCRRILVNLTSLKIDR